MTQFYLKTVRNKEDSMKTHSPDSITNSLLESQLTLCEKYIITLENHSSIDRQTPIAKKDLW